MTFLGTTFVSQTPHGKRNVWESRFFSTSYRWTLFLMQFHWAAFSSSGPGTHIVHGPANCTPSGCCCFPLETVSLLLIIWPLVFPCFIGEVGGGSCQHTSGVGVTNAMALLLCTRLDARDPEAQRGPEKRVGNLNIQYNYGK